MALQPFEDLEDHRVLVFQMLEDDFDLELGFGISREIRFGAGIRMAAVKILTDHEERHHHQLENIHDEKP